MTDTRATPDEIRDRVLADIAARPSIRPYLTDLYERQKPGPKPADSEALERRRLERAAYRRAWRERRAGVDG